MESCTIDDVQLYLARHIRVLPHLYNEYLEALEHEQIKHKAVLTPTAIFQLYHIKLYKRLTRKIYNSNLTRTHGGIHVANYGR